MGAGLRQVRAMTRAKTPKPQCKHPEESHHVLAHIVFGGVIQCDKCLCSRKVGEKH